MMIRGFDAVLGSSANPVKIYGARCVLTADENASASIRINGSRIESFTFAPHNAISAEAGHCSIDLTGYLVLPGLINAHDHLEFALYPRMGDPPYRNYVEWGKDVHAKFVNEIKRQKQIPKAVRLWWGGLRNLLCGVTTVCHHNPLWPELTRTDFPVRVVRGYGWAHSAALGGDILAARAATPRGRPFIVHACEGIDDFAQSELQQLDALDILDEYTVLVHGLAMDDTGVALLNDRRSSLIVCPSSNKFLFDRFPSDLQLNGVNNVALGSDSPLTSAGDLLDEVRFAVRYCGVRAHLAFDMVTRNAASILRLENGEGGICEGGGADLIAIRDTGASLAERLCDLSLEDVEFVIVGGRVQLASGTILDRLGLEFRQGLEQLSLNGKTRWLRAPVAELVRMTEEALGGQRVMLGNREVSLPVFAEAGHVR
jgi:cytosine/adenosine deaminase-related metal-dependent hydrolase